MHPRLRLDIAWSDMAAALAPPRRDARAEIAALWPGRTALPCLSVRTAFDVLLRTLDLGQRDEIVISAVNIESMAEVARAHGVRLVPVDIELTTLAPAPEAVAAAITPNTKIVLIAHLFGAQLALAPYRALLPDGVLLVEDCAQAWGGDFRGSAEADVSLFSFGPIKRRTALGGAVAVFRDAELAQACAALEQTYAPMSEFWFARRVGKFAALKAASAPAVYGAVFTLVQAITGDAERTIGAAARGFPPGELLVRLRRRPPQRMLTLLLRRLTRPYDDEARIEAARHLLGRLPVRMREIGAAVETHCFWLTPILVDAPDEAVEAMRRRGYDVTRGATSLRALGDDAHPAPEAARMIAQVLYLPAPWDMTRSERIAFGRSLRRVCGAPPEEFDAQPSLRAQGRRAGG